jgi:uncharacterized protein (TIGR02001 family)
MHSVLRQSGSLVVALALGAIAHAGQAPQSVTANVGLYSQYVFRGLTQTNGKPAIQGGADYAHPSGLYAGTSLSNISWFSDTNAGNSSSLEWDLYGGVKHAWSGGFTSDLGFLRYQYPGSYPALPAGTVEPNTSEAYAAIGWKWASLKYSYALSDIFGVADSKGGDYLDLTLTVPLNDTFSIAGHAGRQRYTGASAAAAQAGTTNSALYNYDDYRATLTCAFAQGWSALVTYTHTNARDAGYTVLGKNIGDDQFVLGVTRNL